MDNILLLFLGLSPTEAILIFGAVLLLFGGRKIPELMRGLGKGINEFNQARNTVTKELRDGMNEPNQPNNNPDRKELPNP
jgi:sec-independent protein translocase protein TatA